MDKIKNNHGLTLIEMLFAFVLLGVVLAAGFSIYSLGTDTHHRAESQSELQHDTLKVADFITQALHSATEVQILASASDVPEAVNDDYNYIYLYRASGTTVDSVVFKNKNGMTSLVNQYTSANHFLLLFRPENSGKTCYYRIDGDSGTQSYYMESKVKLENTTIGSALAQGSALKFKIDSLSNIQITGTSIDDTVGLIGTEVDSGNNSWKIVLSYVTIKDGISTSDIEIIGLPFGLGYSVAKVDNALIVTVTGPASSAISGEQILSMFIKPSAVVEANAQTSQAIPIKLVPSAANTFSSYVLNDNVFVYGSELSVSGSTSCSGDNSTIVIRKQADGNLTFSGNNSINVNKIYIDNNVILSSSTKLGLTGTTELVYITGNVTFDNGGASINADTVFIDGNATFANSAVINANAVYIRGNVTFENWSAAISATSYYIGGSVTLKQSGNLSGSRVYTVPNSPTFPSFDIGNSLRSDSWYAEKGYVSGGSLADGKKIYSAGSYSFNKSATYNNVVIVSKGDINLSGWMTLGGVLFAPYGKITFDGASFEGVAIARDGLYMTNGGSKIVFKNISNYFAAANYYPFL